MIWVAVGGVVGSLFRYLLNEIFGSDKTGVLIANQLGVALAAFSVSYFLTHPNLKLKNFVIPGFCGGLTTFSSVMLLSNEFGYSYIFENLAISLLVIALTYPWSKQRA